MITQPTVDNRRYNSHWQNCVQKIKRSESRIIYRRYNTQTKLGTEPFVRSCLVSSYRNQLVTAEKKKEGGGRGGGGGREGKKMMKRCFVSPLVCLNALINGSNKTRFRNRVIKI